jgi:hypothetical protein
MDTESTGNLDAHKVPKKFLSRLDRFAQSHWFATLANVLGVFAGLVGSLYTDDIRNAFPFELHELSWKAFSIRAFLFWSCFIVFAFTFLWRERSLDSLREKSARRLEETIRTMPPRGFVSEFAKYHAQCHKAVRGLDAEQKPTPEQVREVIRMLLSSFAHLARKYDAAHEATYSANIMLYFQNVDAWRQYAKEPGTPDIKFAENEAATDRLPLLAIDKTLSVSTANERSPTAVDPALANIRNIALPIPDDTQTGRSVDNKRWRVLPGAPLTFFTRKPNAYDDTAELGKWCRERGDFSESVCTSVEEYFTQDAVRKHIRSFASIPIIPALGSARIGVVNIHADRTGILSDPSAASQFFPLTDPFMLLLADTVARLLKTTE